MKKKKEVVIFREFEFYEDIKSFIKYLEEIAKSLDNGTYDKIHVQTDYKRDYGGSIISILSIVGTRDENDEEYEARLEFENERNKLREKEELQEFNRLKKKFGEEK